MRNLTYLILAMLWLSVSNIGYGQGSSFRSSDAELNSISEAATSKMQQLEVGGIIPNYLHISAEQAMLDSHASEAYSGYLDKISQSQGEDGRFAIAPFVAVSEEGEYFDLATAAVVVPWYRYLYGGDDGAIRSSYQMMRLWMASYRSAAKSCSRGDSPEAKESLASIYYYGMLTIMRDISGEIGRKEDKGNFTHLANMAKEEFNRYQVKGGGVVVGDNSITTLSLALYHDILAPQNRDLALRRLISSVKDIEGALNIDIDGIKALLSILSESQEHELAFEVAKKLAREGEEILYVINGWLFSYVAGIRSSIDGAGFRSAIIKPTPLGGVDLVEATARSQYGDIISLCEKRDDGYYYATFTIPTGVTATIILPNGFEERVGEGTYHRTW